MMVNKEPDPTCFSPSSRSKSCFVPESHALSARSEELLGSSCTKGWKNLSWTFHCFDCAIVGKLKDFYVLRFSSLAKEERKMANNAPLLKSKEAYEPVVINMAEKGKNSII